MIQPIINSEALEVTLLAIVMILLVLNELMSGIAVNRLRRWLHLSLVPLLVTFLLVVVVRLVHLL